ncbi:MAG: dipeptide ABC transporter ATP-binding protein [Acidimicrobiales bacterium]
MALLDVRDLRVSFATDDGIVEAVQGLSFSVERGQTLGIVGESGSGKSVATQAILGLSPAAQVTGWAEFEGRDLLSLKEEQMRAIRGARISMIFQDPLTSLHPLFRVGRQIAEAIEAHEAVSQRAAEHRAVELLEVVGIPHPARRARDFPHQFSGGMRQRVMIAMAIALRPALVIADEPTTALDVTVQAQILELLSKLQTEFNTAIILITHDLGVVADFAKDVVVMYAGRAMERASVKATFTEPHHPYTQGLLESIPIYASRAERLQPIKGNPPSSLRRATTCPFAPRCPHVRSECLVEPPPLRPVGHAPGHLSACILPSDRVGTTAGLSVREPAAITAASSDGVAADDILLELEEVVKHFPVKGGAFAGHSGLKVRAVDGVSLQVHKGETLGLVGESGCGKSTLARLMTLLLPVTSGRVRFLSKDLTSLSRGGMRPLRRQLQMVFQDPYGSLNPRRRVGSILGDPFAVHNVSSGAERKHQVQELMEMVGLSPEHFNRFPSEFSGGQRQRIGIARALALKPKLIICDEPVSALDVSIQAQIINLLEDLQKEFDLTLVFIAHDLSVVRHVSDRVAVMYLGRIAEIGPVEAIYMRARHPYTASLLSAVPLPEVGLIGKRRERVLLSGGVPSPVNPPSGCRFHPRCPKAKEICAHEEPGLRHMEGDPEGRLVACHFPVEPGDTLAAAAWEDWSDGESPAITELTAQS